MVGFVRLGQVFLPTSLLSTLVLTLQVDFTKAESRSQRMEAKGKGGTNWVAALIAAAVLFLLCWPVAYFGSDWAVYWGLWLLSVLFALAVTYIRTVFWE